MTIDFPVLIMRWLNFAIMAGLILKFGWKPFTSLLDNFSDESQDNINEALSSKQKSQDVLAINQKKIDNSDKEVADILAQAEKKSEEVAISIADETERELLHLKEHSKAEIKYISYEAKALIQKEFSEQAVNISREHIIKNINKTDYKKFNKNFISMIKEKT